MERDKKIPLYEIIVDENDLDSGFIRNSFVEQPAVEYNKFAFNKHQAFNFSSDDDEQKFMGVSILADVPIYRRTPDGFEFNVVFKPKTIKTILGKLTKENKRNEVVLYHNSGEPVEGVYMVESFISEKSRVSSPLFDVPDGSLITTYWVPDREQYLELKNNPKFNGFSIELNEKTGLMQLSEMSEDEVIDEVKRILASDIPDEAKEEKIKRLL